MLSCRGIRGAITVEANTREAILEATRELMTALIIENDIDELEVASVTLTTTRDLTAEYPAVAVRALGWEDVPLLCGHEMEVPHGLAMVVRVLIHWNTVKAPDEIRHLYLKDAASLRPDRTTLRK